MKLSIELKPTKVVGKTRNDIMGKIRAGHGFSSTTDYKCLQRFGNRAFSFTGELRLYNLHKVRGKTKQIKYENSNEKTGAIKGRTCKSEVVRESHWVGYYYDIDPALLKALGLKVRQNARNFTFSKK